MPTMSRHSSTWSIKNYRGKRPQTVRGSGGIRYDNVDDDGDDDDDDEEDEDEDEDENVADECGRWCWGW